MRGFMRSTHASDSRANKATPGGCSRCNRGRHCNHGGPRVRKNRSIHMPPVVETPISPDNGHGELPPDQIPRANITPAEPLATPTADVSELPHEGSPVQVVEEHPVMVANNGASMIPIESGSRTSTVWCGPTQDGGKGVKASNSPRAIHPGEPLLHSIPFVFQFGRNKRIRRGAPLF